MSDNAGQRTAFEAAHDKRRVVNAAEAAGEIVDSMAVRMALIARVRSGEISLADAQAEIRKLQLAAKATRAQVFSRG